MIELKEDDPEAIDVLLVYLYTLELPNFHTPQYLHGNGCQTMTNVFLVADKYDIKELRKASKAWLLTNNIGNHLHAIDAWSSAYQRSLIRMVEDIWTWEIHDAKDFQGPVITSLLRTSATIVEKKPFQALLDSNKDFRMAFIRGLAQR